MCNSMHIMSKPDLFEPALRCCNSAPSAPLSRFCLRGNVTILATTEVTAVTFLDVIDLLKSSVTVRYRETQPSISGIEIMRMRYVSGLFLLFSYCFGLSGTAHGQQAPSTTTRRVVQKMNPVYPDIAKRMNLSGTVKVVAVVLADGMVKSVEPVGGSPVLLKAAQDAVVKWRFAPGGESRELIELRFDPQ